RNHEVPQRISGGTTSACVGFEPTGGLRVSFVVPVYTPAICSPSSSSEEAFLGELPMNAVTLPKLACLAVTLGLAVCASACAASGEEAPASSEAALGQWQTMMTCNGGAAVLDVDPGERRQAQFVIRDANAINYLTGAVGLQFGPLNRGNGRELIVAG